MPTTTTNTPLILDATLAARWQEFTSALYNPAAQDINGELKQIAEAWQSNIAPLFGVYAQRLLDDRSTQPATTTELLNDFSLFITQGIAEHEQRAIDFEQKFIQTFQTHAIIRLRPQSFRTGALAMTNSSLKSAIDLGEKLNAERILLERENTELHKAFNDPDGRIILAHDRIHTVSNKLTVIMGCAQGLMQGEHDNNTLREYLQAIHTTIRNFAERDRPTLEDNPIELVRRMHPRVDVIMHGITPVFSDEQHPMLVVKALGHLIDNAFKAGAKNVRIKAECQPSDPILTIGIEDDGHGMPEDMLQQLVSGKGGSGWRILRKITLRQLNAHYKIVSPFQSSEPHGTLVMLFIPVMAQTGDEPSTGRRRKADSGPLSAVSTLTPSAPLPAVQRPVSMAAGLEPNIAGGPACFAENPPGVLLRFPKLK
jgi:signal transduction histidine kinase